MMRGLGIGGLDDLFADIPPEVKFQGMLNIPEAKDEIELKEMFKSLGKKNLASDYVSFIGAGAYDHYIPAAVKALVGRSEFYTAYTPYQAERSQGTLAAIFEYQTMIASLTGMDVVNASVYDGASSLAEAMLMACDIKNKNEIVVSGALHPEYVETAVTYGEGVGITVKSIPYTKEYATDWNMAEEVLTQKSAALVLAVPNFFGTIEDVGRAKVAAKKAGALFIVAANPVSLGLLKAPGEYGADIVVGEGQPLGNPLNFGGPYLGFMGTRKQYVRRLPGRIVGETKDSEGKRAFVLTLQAREQHIRREKATSNLCSNQALNALAATVYLSLLGKTGLRDVAYHSHLKARYFIDKVKNIKHIKVLNANIFNELVVEVGYGKLEKTNLSPIIPGVPLQRIFPHEENRLLIAFTEKRTKSDIDALIHGLGAM